MTAEGLKGRLTTIVGLRKFVLAGNATFTIRSKLTGVRYTFKVRRKEGTDLGGLPHNFWFCSLLTGEDNEGDYSYFGYIFSRPAGSQDEYVYRHGGAKAKVGENAPSMVAWDYFIKLFTGGWVNEVRQRHLDKIEVWHEGKCGACGRKLSVPESISSGFGPECIRRQ